MPSARAKLDKLRRETSRTVLEELEAQAAGEERREAYLGGLARERAGVVTQLALLRQRRPEARWWEPHEPQVGEPASAAERVARAEANLALIDGEIDRASK